METMEIGLEKLREAPWNPNQQDEITAARLRESLTRFGLVNPLVVRPIDDLYQVLSGNQRLKALKDMKIRSVPCIIVNLNDERAMLLAQALNGIRGEDDPVKKGQLLKKVLESISEKEVLSLLPESAESLKALSAMGETDMAEYLQSWQQAQSARLRHMQLQFTTRQLETVEEAVSLITPEAKEGGDNPNIRGNAFYLLCKFYLERSQV